MRHETTDPGDAARIELLLAELRLPAIKLVWASVAAQADKEIERFRLARQRAWRRRQKQLDTWTEFRQ